MSHKRTRIDTTLPALKHSLSSAWIGHAQLTPEEQEFEARPKRHGWLALVWCAGGAAHYPLTDHVRYQRNRLTVIPPRVDIRNHIVPGDVLSIHYVTLLGPMIDDWLASLPPGEEFASDVHVLQIPRMHVFMAHLTDTNRFAQDASGWSWLGALSQTLSAIDHHFRSDVADDILDQVRQLVDGHPYRVWSAPVIARKLNISESSLSREFRTRTGESVMRWVRKRRMHVAASMLANGMSVSDVAQALNASSPYSFSRCFKEVFGVAPSTIREEGLDV